MSSFGQPAHFLFDGSSAPYLTAKHFSQWFGLSSNTIGGKAKEVRKLLGNIYPMNPAWTLPSRLGDNMMTWMLSIDGFIVDIRHAPRLLQEEALRKGLIPFIPGEQE